MVLRRVHRYSIHPRIKRTIAAEPWQRPVCLDERFLCYVERQLGIAHIPHHQVDYLVLVFEYQQIERALVSFLDSFDQLLVR